MAKHEAARATRAAPGAMEGASLREVEDKSRLQGKHLGLERTQWAAYVATMQCQSMLVVCNCPLHVEFLAAITPHVTLAFRAAKREWLALEEHLADVSARAVRLNRKRELPVRRRIRELQGHLDAIALLREEACTKGLEGPARVGPGEDEVISRTRDLDRIFGLHAAIGAGPSVELLG